ncbi:MAG: hypothetical protein R2911_20025 [Caldilineaceae bacterium]
MAHQTFRETNKPLIYTYFRQAAVSTSDVNIDDLISLRNFKQKLGELATSIPEYESIDGLQIHFQNQLNVLRDSQRL